MEFFRWILILTGIVLLGIAYMMGRKRKPTSVYHRATPEAYDPSLDELSVPITDPLAASVSEVPAARSDALPGNRGYEGTGESSVSNASANSGPADREWRSNEPGSEYSTASYHHDDVNADTTGAAATDFDRELDHDDYNHESLDPVHAEIGIRDDFEEVDLALDDPTHDAGRVTSFASAVKQAGSTSAIPMVGAAGLQSPSGNQADKNFADEFDTYHDAVQLEDFEEKLVTVHVQAANGRRFYGSDLKALFDQHGYQFGRMSLYHCALDGDKVFSIANMVKPGTFDEDLMATFETPGITLFMRLPIELDADVAFDFLIREAKELASELDGHLRDGNRNPLSEQTIQHMREDIQQYVFRSKRVLHTTV